MARGHAGQVAAEALVPPYEYVFAVHAAATPNVPLHVEPAGHGTDAALDTTHTEPESQLVTAVRPTVGQTLLTVHAVHDGDVAPEEWKDPAGHRPAHNDDARPVTSPYVPPGQGTAAVALAGQ